MNLINGLQQAILGVSAVIAAYLPGVTNTIQPNPARDIPKNVIVRTGQYSYANQTLKYLVNIPKGGGKVTGNFSGACSGPIEGSFAGTEGGSVEGKAKATCPILLNKKLTATYNGKLYLNEGKIDLNWQGNIPYTSGNGSFTITFEPVN